MTMIVLLAATFLGTVSNNVVNVVLPTLDRDLGVQPSGGVLVVSGFVVVLAAATPVTGWIGDRFGRRRTLLIALILMAGAMAGAALAPSLPVLVLFRACQGLACAAIPPAVMGMLAARSGPGRRIRVMGAWATANGVGQAAGPPLGGFVGDALGWRAIFWLLAVLSVLVAAGAIWRVPADRGRRTSLHWPGAGSLTVGAALVMTAATAVSQPVVPRRAVALLAVVGLALLVVFVVVSRAASRPLIPPRSLVETRFLRSVVAAFAQMFCLAALLVTIPLYLSGSLGSDTVTTGLLVFSLPAAMALLAPAVAALGERAGPRRVLRTGLVILVAVPLLLGLRLDRQEHHLVVLAAMMSAAGAGIALVQTPSASGATRSPGGPSGASLGLFTMARFTGSAFGTAWVALTYQHATFAVLFGGCAVVAAIALCVSFAGPNPTPLPANAGTRATTPA